MRYLGKRCNCHPHIFHFYLFSGRVDSGHIMCVINDQEFNDKGYRIEYLDISRLNVGRLTCTTHLRVIASLYPLIMRDREVPCSHPI